MEKESQPPELEKDEFSCGFLTCLSNKSSAFKSEPSNEEEKKEGNLLLTSI